MLTLRTSRNLALSEIALSKRAILRVTTNPQLPAPLRSQHALLISNPTSVEGPPFAVTLVANDSLNRGSAALPPRSIRIDPEIRYLADGDVVKVAPNLKISVLFRKDANAHSLLVTERCNSFCVMCSQPPRDIDDGNIVEDLLEAIPLFDRDTKEIGFTGGEPTLLGSRLYELIRCAKSYLPNSALHVLSNGRKFENIDVAKGVATVGHPDLMFGIPLYSDISSVHDFVVQADGAYDETIRGILNLKRCNVRVELRVVIHRLTIDRLPELSRFIARNLLFVDHVALMGLELTGFAKANLGELWVDPFAYRESLADVADFLHVAGIKVSIYNHQLCILAPRSRRFAVKSISDWKNEYLPICSECSVRHSCGGFFSSSAIRYSEHIHPLSDLSVR